MHKCGKIGTFFQGETMANKTNFITRVGISALLLAMACGIARGKTIYVDDDAQLGGNGQIWGTAYHYLQDALAAASSGDLIWVAQGIYKPVFERLLSCLVYGVYIVGQHRFEVAPNVHDGACSGSYQCNRHTALHQQEHSSK